jgi:predicted GH43/DUF377 family glycosyl hydrolase
MRWVKGGKIFQPSGEGGWMNTHAQGPTVLVLEDRIRVYFASRLRNDLGLITFIDLDRDNPKHILYLHEKPILQPGRPGTFDNHGLLPNHVRRVGDKVLLYYLGWYRGSSVPYHIAVGLALSNDDGLTFEKMFKGPVLDRSACDPHSVGAVAIVEKDNLLHAFYTEFFEWIDVRGRLEPLYHIKYASSEDGVSWQKADRVCIGQRHDREAVARPAIVLRNGRYHMWFCYRGSNDFRDGADSYRIGYAWSDNLLDWTREDRLAGITVSPDGWDSKMLAYPYIVEVGGRQLMFYNGNGFGASGFGYATASWSDDDGGP